MPNLKRLFLEECTSLRHVDESIRVLSKLEELILLGCKSLVSLPGSIFRLPSLQLLQLGFCSKLKNPFEKSAFTSTIVQKAVMSPFQFFSKRQKQPSEPLLHGLRSLQSLQLCFSNLRELPDAIGRMKSLISLDLRGNKFVTVPSTINNLSKLAYLDLGKCTDLQYLPELPVSIDADFSGEKLPSNRISNVHFGFLYIYNCPQLVENEIQPYTKLALSWLTKLVQAPHDLDTRIEVVIPGNDVPKWFNQQSLACSTRVLLPCSSEWIGVALCVALAPTGNDVYYYDTELMAELCGTQKTIDMALFKSNCGRWKMSLKSGHLLLLYLPREMSICRISQTWEVGKEVEFRVIGKDYKMMKCGARWVSEQDIQELQLLKEQC